MLLLKPTKLPLFTSRDWSISPTWWVRDFLLSIFSPSFISLEDSTTCSAPNGENNSPTSPDGSKSLSLTLSCTPRLETTSSERSQLSTLLQRRRRSHKLLRSKRRSRRRSTRRRMTKNLQLRLLSQSTHWPLWVLQRSQLTSGRESFPTTSSRLLSNTSGTSSTTTRTGRCGRSTTSTTTS
ncbi:hypothetical protein PGUG_00593 [Meyerozyma guilliermondii ATCC 6260]|uniref:Uncharacterized protein n=1 Tax=Meyerozyma guilliermondii (strain ATCC 6260 / CBS 566 / DSM 6381 / JCM 1539 / NBRC 10279 / NRRL Y-324) TaxID=294746 RepID=A5DBD8_PICGU|nr:uncharacterized protein PGUG_00593 [Meyerozyma guilliermondii ATCC 6260]EDK36495.2 hypothetical protein PGUG_00593 [Meyerozyma guilliermondii ATCC 6260]